MRLEGYLPTLIAHLLTFNTTHRMTGGRGRGRSDAGSLLPVDPVKATPASPEPPFVSLSAVRLDYRSRNHGSKSTWASVGRVVGESTFSARYAATPARSVSTSRSQPRIWFQLGTAGDTLMERG